MLLARTPRIPRITRFGHLIPRTRTHGQHAPAAAGRAPHPSEPHRKQSLYSRGGKVRTGILLWLLGVPIPIILLIFLVKGCVT